MTTTVRDQPSAHRYELVLDDEVVGWADYRLDGTRITILHAEVDRSHAGQGLGSELVTRMLDDLAERGLEVIPRCPYVRSVIADNADRYLELVPADAQHTLGLEQNGE